jgi:Sec-independent protein translocase protein TatA
MNGWKFSSLKDKELSTKTVKDLCDIAVKATQALDLSFSAVDCAIDEDGNPYVIELNTGPGVTGKTFDKWVEQFKNYIDTLTKPAKEDTKNVSKDKSTAKDDASKDKNAKSGKKQSTIDKINTLQSKFDYIKSLIANADSDEEADIILKAASKDVDIEAAAGAKFFG